MSNQVKVYDNVKKMKNDTSLQDGDYVATKGYYFPGDGGHGNYVIEKSSSAAVIDEGSVISLFVNLSRPIKLNAYLIHDGTVNIKQFGAYDDCIAYPNPPEVTAPDRAVRTANAIQNAINFISMFGSLSVNCPQTPMLKENSYGGRVFIPSGTYVVSKGINIAHIVTHMVTDQNGEQLQKSFPKILELYGEGYSSVIQAGGPADNPDNPLEFLAEDDSTQPYLSKKAVLYSSVTFDQSQSETYSIPHYHRFSSFQIIGKNNVAYGIFAETIAHALFENLIINGTCNAAIATGYGWCNRFYNCKAKDNKGDGFKHVRGDNNNNLYLGCTAGGNEGIGFNIGSGKAITIRDCGIEGNLKAGILARAVLGLSIVDNYFESNGRNGLYMSPYEERYGNRNEDLMKYTFSSYRHDIIINGYCGTNSEKLLHTSVDYLGGTTTISGNYVSESHWDKYLRIDLSNKPLICALRDRGVIEEVKLGDTPKYCWVNLKKQTLIETLQYLDEEMLGVLLMSLKRSSSKFPHGKPYAKITANRSNLINQIADLISVQLVQEGVDSFVYASAIAGGEIKNNQLTEYPVPLFKTSNWNSNHYIKGLSITGNHNFSEEIIYDIVENPLRSLFPFHPPLIQHTNNFNFCPPFDVDIGSTNPKWFNSHNSTNCSDPGTCKWGYFKPYYSGLASQAIVPIKSNGYDVFVIDIKDEYSRIDNGEKKLTNAHYFLTGNISTFAFDDIKGKYMYFAFDMKSEIAGINVMSKVIEPSGNIGSGCIGIPQTEQNWKRYYIIFRYPENGDLQIYFQVYESEISNEYLTSAGRIRQNYKIYFKNPALRYIGAQDVF